MDPKDTVRINAIDPVEIVLRGRQQQRASCDELEAIADQLLDRVNPEFCSTILNVFSHALPLFQSDEEALYDIIRVREAENILATKLIDLAITEHRRHEDYALELVDQLSDLAIGQSVRNAEATGYMLRCAFENIRRHLDWEEITLFGGSFHAITAEDKPALSARLAHNRRALASNLRVIT